MRRVVAGRGDWAALLAGLAFGLGTGFVGVYSFGALLLPCWVLSALVVCRLARRKLIALSVVPATVAGVFVAWVNLPANPNQGLFYAAVWIVGVLVSLGVALALRRRWRKP